MAFPLTFKRTVFDTATGTLLAESEVTVQDLKGIKELALGGLLVAKEPGIWRTPKAHGITTQFKLLSEDGEDQYNARSVLGG